METIGIFAPRNMQCNHSCVFQFQFWSSFFLARNSQGLDPAVMLVCSKWDLLDMWVLPMGVASPGWIGRCNLGLAFTHGFIYSQLQVSSLQSLICVRLFAIPWTAARQASLSITNSWAYSNSCPLSQWCHPTISFSVVSFSYRLQSFPASGSFPMTALCITWPKYWSYSFSISPSNAYSGLISFSMDWLDFLAIQGSLKSLLQYHISKASILRLSAL